MLTFLTILLFTVVIDAGHGGKDPGAVGKRCQEKDINLSVSLLLGDEIKRNYPEVNVLYTRDDDRFIPLQGRADFVNKNKADLFICIHTNSAENRESKGAETFVLGTEKMSKNLDVAMRENAVIMLEDDYKTAYQGFDPNSIESYIMFELMQNNYMDQSLQFASLVQHQFAGNLKRADRGVRQAAFWVLLKSACPSVLVELGFVSNAEEEKYLGSATGQSELAHAIYSSFSSYYSARRVAPEKPAVEKSSAATSKPATSKPTTTKPTTSKKPASKQAPVPEASTEGHKQANVPEVSTEGTTPQERWAVQILTSRTILDASDARLKGEKPQYIEKDGLYKYYTAVSATRDEAKTHQNRLKSRFDGCFVIKL